MSDFTMGGFASFSVDSPMELLALMERICTFVLETGTTFAVSDHGSNFVQLLADADGDLHIESSFGDLAVEANLGFKGFVPEFDFIAQGFLPAAWPGRQKMAAEVLTRTLVDVHRVSFPVQITVFTDRSADAPQEAD